MAFFFVEIRQEIALKAVKNDGLALPHCHRSLREDRDVVLCAVQSTWDGKYMGLGWKKSYW